MAETTVADDSVEVRRVMNYTELEAVVTNLRDDEKPLPKTIKMRHADLSAWSLAGEKPLAVPLSSLISSFCGIPVEVDDRLESIELVWEAEQDG